MADSNEQVILQILGDIRDVSAKIDAVKAQIKGAFEVPISESPFAKRLQADIAAVSADLDAKLAEVERGVVQLEEEAARMGDGVSDALNEAALTAVALAAAINEAQQISKRWTPILSDFHRSAEETFGANATAVVERFFRSLNPKSFIEDFGTLLGQIEAQGQRLVTTLNAQSEASDKAQQARVREVHLIDEVASSIDKEIKRREEAREGLVKFVEYQEESGRLTGAVLDETKLKVRDLLNAYDRAGEKAPADIQAIADRLGVLSDAQKRAAEEAKRLAEEQERAATRAAEAKLRQAEREVEASLRSAERQVEDSKRIAESVRGETKDLEARTEAVVSWAQEVASSGTASREEIAQVRKVVQDQLDVYSRLGKEAPADLQAVAKSWHVTTSDVERDAEKAAKAAQTLQKEFASLVDRLNKGTNAKNPADELAAALAERDQLSNKSTQSQEDLDRITELDQKISDLRFSVKEEGDTWFSTNKRIELSTKDVRQAVLDLFSSSRDSLRDLSQDQRDEIQRTLQNLLTLGDSGKASASDLDSALRGVRDVLQGAGVDTSDLDISLEKAGGQAFDLNRAFDDLGKKDVKETIGGVAALGDESEKSAEKQKAISEQIAAWRKELEQIKKDDALGTAGQSAEQLRDRLKEVTEIAKELRKTLAGTDTGAGGEGGDAAP